MSPPHSPQTSQVSPCLPPSRMVASLRAAQRCGSSPTLEPNYATEPPSGASAARHVGPPTSFRRRIGYRARMLSSRVRLTHRLSVISNGPSLIDLCHPEINQ